LQENVPLEEVFQTLRCDSNGLTTKSAEERLSIFGHNKLEEKQVLPFNFLPLLLMPLPSSVGEGTSYLQMGNKPLSPFFDGKNVKYTSILG